MGCKNRGFIELANFFFGYPSKRKKGRFYCFAPAGVQQICPICYFFPKMRKSLPKPGKVFIFAL
jgi:hypothetical protein